MNKHTYRHTQIIKNYHLILDIKICKCVKDQEHIATLMSKAKNKLKLVARGESRVEFNMKRNIFSRRLAVLTILVYIDNIDYFLKAEI